MIEAFEGCRLEPDRWKHRLLPKPIAGYLNVVLPSVPPWVVPLRGPESWFLKEKRRWNQT